MSQRVWGELSKRSSCHHLRHLNPIFYRAQARRKRIFAGSSSLVHFTTSAGFACCMHQKETPILITKTTAQQVASILTNIQPVFVLRQRNIAPCLLQLSKPPWAPSSVNCTQTKCRSLGTQERGDMTWNLQRTMTSLESSLLRFFCSGNFIDLANSGFYDGVVSGKTV